jgi:hypothetical protein
VKWTGTIKLKGIQTTGTFKVFDSTEGWSFLLGKPLLKSFRAHHNYECDEIQVSNARKSTVLTNQIGNPYYTRQALQGIPLTVDWKQGQKGASTAVNSLDKISRQEERKGKAQRHQESREVEAPVQGRQTDPFHPRRVEAVLRAITIGDDLSDSQRKEVSKLVGTYADCFALSVHEVILVKDTRLHLNIPADTQLPTKARQCTFTPPQRCYLHKKILEMLNVGIIKCADPAKIKCVSATTLGQKQYKGTGLTLEELQQKVNRECEAAGLMPHFQVQPKQEQVKAKTATEQEEQKWRICQDFQEVNKLSKVAPMPQGDIRAKQHRLSSYKYVSVIDFTSGFYAVEIDQNSRPYMAFYVEGLGHFWYVRMPFRLTGAPTAFAAMAANYLHDLIADEMMEIFVDDGGAAADTLDEMRKKLKRILDRICK